MLYECPRPYRRPYPNEYPNECPCPCPYRRPCPYVDGYAEYVLLGV